MQTVEGFLLIDKPEHITSFLCVGQIKKLLGKKTKVGHGGTLDPFASGLMVIGIERTATRHLGLLLHGDKTYTVTAKLGELTTTLDSTGTHVSSATQSIISHETLHNAVTAFPKKYEQIPPIFSALKHQGKPLYEFARRGKKTTEQLERIAQHKKRDVEIKNILLISYEHPFFTLEVTVSHGTYIRSLVNDIAQTIGLHATAYTLRRTKLGACDIRNAVPLEIITTREIVEQHHISSAAFLHLTKPTG